MNRTGVSEWPLPLQPLSPVEDDGDRPGDAFDFATNGDGSWTSSKFSAEVEVAVPDGGSALFLLLLGISPLALRRLLHDPHLSIVISENRKRTAS